MKNRELIEFPRDDFQPPDELCWEFEKGNILDMKFLYVVLSIVDRSPMRVDRYQLLYPAISTEIRWLVLPNPFPGMEESRNSTEAKESSNAHGLEAGQSSR